MSRPRPQDFGIPRHAGLGMGAALVAILARSASRPKSSTPDPVASLTILPAGPPGSWAVDLPGWHPPSLNELLRWNKYKRGRMLAEVDRTIAGACLAAGVVKAVGKRRLTITLVAPKGRKRKDDDNSRKAINDSLVTCGALVDDGPDFLEVVPVIYATGPAGTGLVIEDI